MHWFQSTHPRGVRRPAQWATCWRTGCFNPRTRVGCDDQARAAAVAVGVVSIHAPAWGATDKQFDVLARLPVSIHAPAWGATRGPCSRPSSVFVFQSTHPRGVRLTRPFPVLRARKFQSTHPRGVRLHGTGHIAVGDPVSIHAPAWGATALDGLDEQRVTGFNPRTRVGCDTRRRALTIARDQFQSTHPRGVRPHHPGPGEKGPPMFQSTHPRGVRQDIWQAAFDNKLFQSTHPRGVRLRQLC